MKSKTLEEGQWADIVVISPDGALHGYDCTAELSNLQALVGGYIEVVPHFDKIGGMSCAVLCDEEGKLKGKPLNNRATLEWKKAYNIADDYLVGDVVVLTGKAKKEFEQ